MQVSREASGQRNNDHNTCNVVSPTDYSWRLEGAGWDGHLGGARDSSGSAESPRKRRVGRPADPATGNVAGVGVAGLSKRAHDAIQCKLPLVARAFTDAWETPGSPNCLRRPGPRPPSRRPRPSGETSAAKAIQECLRLPLRDLKPCHKKCCPSAFRKEANAHLTYRFAPLPFGEHKVI